MVAPELAELQLMARHLPGFALIVDADLRIRWINRVDPTLKLEDVLGQHFDAFVPEPERSVGREVVERCLQLGEPGEYLGRGYRDGGWDGWYGCRVVPLPPAVDGRPRALVLSIDETNRVRADHALQSSEARFRSLVETSPDFIVVLNRRREFVFVNRETELLGRRVDESIDAPSLERAVAVIEEVFCTGIPSAYESGSSLGAERYHVQVALLPGSSDDPQVLLVVRDVTDRHKAEVHRKWLIAELDHRVKNALATVQAIAEQTLRHTTSFDLFRATFEGRVRSLAAAHEALASNHWEGVGVAHLIRIVVQPLSERRLNVRCEAQSRTLHARVVTPLALTLHELGTNAVKHGALSSEAGSLSLACQWDGVDLTITWHEVGVSQGQATEGGLGLRLVRGFIEHELGGRFGMAVAERERRIEINVPDCSNPV